MRNKIYSIQILRGLAALFVVLRHVLMDVEKMSTQKSKIIEFYGLLNFGSIGVDVFFVISGFIMYYMHGNDFLKPGISFKFILRRFLRVIPLYWVLTSITLFLLFFFPQLFGGGKTFNLQHTIASYLFIPWNNSIGLPYPILAPGWSLNYEMYFYVLFAILLFFPKKVFFPVILIFFSFSYSLSFIVDDFPLLIMMTNSMLFEFVLGLFIGLLYERNYLFEKNTLVFLIFSILIFSVNIFFSFNHEYRLLFYGIPSAFLIFSFLSHENVKTIAFNKMLVYLGTLSYSLYLSHVFSLKLFIKLIPVSITSEYTDLIIVLTIIFTIVCALVTYHIIEKPFENLSKKMRTIYKF